VDKEMYPDDAIDQIGKKGRLFLDNALMACKMCMVFSWRIFGWRIL
jgi:hypothetical protein